MVSQVTGTADATALTGPLRPTLRNASQRAGRVFGTTDGETVGTANAPFGIARQLLNTRAPC
jgi:hypothetical protein